MMIEKRHLPTAAGKDVRTNIERMFGDAHSATLTMQPYSAALNNVKARLENLDNALSVRLEHNPIHHMEYRIKTPESIVEKLERKGLDLSIDSLGELTDVAGLRVVCHYINDIYVIATLIINQDDMRLIKKRDYIQSPKPNGYRSLHLILETDIYQFEKKITVPVEIQIRTIAMDFWASLEHHLRYKSNGEPVPEIVSRLKQCADTISDTDSEMQEIYQYVNNKWTKHTNKITENT